MQNITHYIKYIKPGEVFLSGRHSRPLTITTLGPTSQKKKRQHNQSDHELSAIARLGDPATTRINSVQYSRPWATLTDTNVGGVGGTAFLKRGEDDQETLSWKIKKKKKKKYTRDGQLPESLADSSQLSPGRRTGGLLFWGRFKRSNTASVQFTGRKHDR